MSDIVVPLYLVYKCTDPCAHFVNFMGLQIYFEYKNVIFTFVFNLQLQI